MATTALEQVLYLVDDSFAGTDWHSLLTNVGAVKPDEWLWVPPGGSRSISRIMRHLNNGKLIYQNYAFGDGTLEWDETSARYAAQFETMASGIATLRQAHERWRASVAALGADDELLRPRQSPFDGMQETRWIIARMIQHDLYHAGEINHIRALCQQDD